jgi:predicted enzyme related to lactoylglutathione lyase
MSQATFNETMIGTDNLEKTAEFYKNFLGMEVSHPGDGQSFLILKDTKTGQNLLIVKDPQIKNALPSVSSSDLTESLEKLVSHGGKVLNQNVYPSMKVANVQDPDGREMCIWQELSKL